MESRPSLAERLQALLGPVWPLVVAVGLSALAFLAALVFVVVGAGTLLILGVAVLEDLVLLVGISILLQGVGFVVVAIGYLAVRGVGIGYLRVRWPTLRDFGWMVAGLFGLFAVLIVVGGLAELLAPAEPADHEIAELGVQQPELLLFLVPLMLLVVGPGEEILFRGVIQTRLVEAYGTAAGIVTASVLFAVAHLPAYGGGGAEAWVSVTVLFVASLVFGAIYEVTDNLVVPAVVHGVYNSILVLGLYAITQMEPATVGSAVGV